MITWKLNTTTGLQHGGMVFHHLVNTMDGMYIRHGLLRYVKQDDQCKITMIVEHMPVTSVLVVGDVGDAKLVEAGLNLAQDSMRGTEVYL